MANIKVTPEELNSQGDSLVSYAGDLSDILKQIDAKIAEIDNGWDGLAQTAYTGMYRSVSRVGSVVGRSYQVCSRGIFFC